MPPFGRGEPASQVPEGCWLFYLTETLLYARLSSFMDIWTALWSLVNREFHLDATGRTVRAQGQHYLPSKSEASLDCTGPVSETNKSRIAEGCVVSDESKGMDLGDDIVGMTDRVW